MRTAKAVVLARGLGKRMRRPVPAGFRLSDEAERMAGRGLKGLIPLRGRPFLDYVVGSLLEAGLRSICLVVAPDCGLLVDYARRTSERTGAALTCAVQPDPLGTADAVLAAEEFVGCDPFIVANGDNLYPNDMLLRLARISDESCHAAAFDRDELLRSSNFPRQRVRAFAAMVVAQDGRLTDIIEKPADPELYVRDGTLWISMNLYRFTPEVFEACRRIEPDPERGELELTAAVRLIARSGATPFRVIFCRGPVLDLTSRADVPTLERLLAGRPPRF